MLNTFSFTFSGTDIAKYVALSITLLFHTYSLFLLWERKQLNFVN